MKIIMIYSVLEYILLEHQTVHNKENKMCKWYEQIILLPGPVT